MSLVAAQNFGGLNQIRSGYSAEDIMHPPIGREMLPQQGYEMVKHPAAERAPSAVQTALLVLMIS
ncbi:MAG: hypothetical protein WB384_16210 [Candidatus Sulfotelmatobacter sp.]